MYRKYTFLMIITAFLTAFVMQSAFATRDSLVESKEMDEDQELEEWANKHVELFDMQWASHFGSPIDKVMTLEEKKEMAEKQEKALTEEQEKKRWQQSMKNYFECKKLGQKDNI